MCATSPAATSAHATRCSTRWRDRCLAFPSTPTARRPRRGASTSPRAPRSRRSSRRNGKRIARSARETRPWPGSSASRTTRAERPRRDRDGGRCQEIGAAIREHRVDEIVVAGGGARHRPLLGAIARRSAAPLRTTVELGVPIEAREALAMAVLGALADDGVEITCPKVTGRLGRAGRAGSWIG
ncbi:MAG: anhydro-N-acetylmuramic acid kinase [Phycisphaerales bacterium]